MSSTITPFASYFFLHNRNKGRYFAQCFIECWQYACMNKGKRFTDLIHIYSLQGFTTSENDSMILILRFSFTNFCWRTWKLDTIYFLAYAYLIRIFWTFHVWIIYQVGVFIRNVDAIYLFALPLRLISYLIQLLPTLDQYRVIKLLIFPVNCLLSLIYISNAQRWIPSRSNSNYF